MVAPTERRPPPARTAAVAASEPAPAHPDEVSEQRPPMTAPYVAAIGRGLHRVWRIVVATVASCLRNRVTGLAAEAAFFAVLSVPPLIFALAGTLGYVTERFTPAQVEEIRSAVIEVASRFLTEPAVRTVIDPTIDSVLEGGRFDVISVGFVLALWSGSRALNVFVDTITIMHGLGGQRGIVATRALSFGLYLMAMLIGVVALPLLVAGPQLVGRVLPEGLTPLLGFYWPLVVALCVCFLATLYHVSVPVRTYWRFNLPGACFSLVAWIVGSFLLRWVLTVTSADSASIYGPLAAPIAVLLWLYVVAIAVLVGAAVNAAFDEVYAQPGTARARSVLRARWRDRGPDHERDRGPDHEPDDERERDGVPGSGPGVG